MSSMILNGDTSGAITVTVPAVAGTNTATIPAATGTVMVSGNMPAFSAYQSSSQSLSSATFTKLQFQTKEYDTASAFDNTTNYRFQPTVAGYYQVSGGFKGTTAASGYLLQLYKFGSAYKYLVAIVSNLINGAYGGCQVYLNGSTDYIELYGYVSVANSVSAVATDTYFQAVMVRAA